MLRVLVDKLGAIFAPSTDPHGIHEKATMEGFFTHLYSSSSTGEPYTLVVIFCEVKHAIDPNCRIMVYVLYAPGHVPPHNINKDNLKSVNGFSCELWSSGWKHIATQGANAKDDVKEWKVQVENVGTMQIGRDRQSWTVQMPAELTMGNGALELVVETTQRTPWTTRSLISGPEGPFERLGNLLPLHWHIFSTASRADWQMRRLHAPARFPESSLANSSESDIIASGTAVAHIEKNHGIGFPTAWIWAHSISESPSHSQGSLSEHLKPNESYPVRFAVAGGKIIGLEAYLVGFRDDERNIAWDFTPPFAMGILGRGLGFKTLRSWEKRTVTLDLWDWGRWLSVEMSAPADTFVPIAGPLSRGFAPELCHESFQATFKITCWERPLGFSILRPWSWFDSRQWAWQKVSSYDIHEAALEFGGDYVGEEARGTKVKGE